MYFNGFTHTLFNFFNSFPGGDTAGKIRAIGGIIASGLFDYYQKLFHNFAYFNLAPDCFKILFNVPGLKSSR